MPAGIKGGHFRNEKSSGLADNLNDCRCCGTFYCYKRKQYYEMTARIK